MTLNPPADNAKLAYNLAAADIEVDGNDTALVIGGGGATNFGSLGMYKALHKGGKLDNLEKVGGTSSGSKFSHLIAMGLKGDELDPYTLDEDFSYLSKIDRASELLALPGNILGKKNGIFVGDDIRQWAEHVSAKRVGKPDISFAQMHEWREKARESLETGDVSFFDTKAREAFVQEEKYGHRYDKFNNLKTQ